MGYRILYHSEKEQESGGRWIRRLLMTAGFFLVFVWSVSQFWQEGRELLRLLLIPGDPETTLQAAQVFAQELGSGYSLADASRNFYLAVLEYGHPG